MNRIITITFNPCIDKNTSVHTLIPEKKLPCTAPVLSAGGGGINVAKAVRRLGGGALAIFPSGGYTGQHLNSLLQKDGVPAAIIEIEEETRENIIVLEGSTNNQFRFGMPGARLKETEWMSCIKAAEQVESMDILVASGSLPPGVPAGIYRRLGDIAKQKGAKYIVDAPGEILREVLQAGVFLMKPNLTELAALAGKEEISPSEAAGIAQRIISGGQCDVIVISLGAAGALLVTNAFCLAIEAPAVLKKSTVGAGDSMVAGIVYRLAQGKTVIEAAQYGVACGSAAAMNPGTTLCNKKDADKLYAAIHSDHIYR